MASESPYEQAPSRNVLGQPLATCGCTPMTGFYRDGCCNTGREDTGLHTVCVVMTAEFLAFSSAHGNDLSTPMPRFGFAGLKPGDRWCLCAPPGLQRLLPARRWRPGGLRAWCCPRRMKGRSATARWTI